MSRRLDLHDELLEVLGSNYVYFQPPESVKLIYPCIIYQKASKLNRYADDRKYSTHDRYDVTVISRDPDNTIAEDLLERFQYCGFSRRYTADNLYHDSLDLYY